MRTLANDCDHESFVIVRFPMAEGLYQRSPGHRPGFSISAQDVWPTAIFNGMFDWVDYGRWPIGVRVRGVFLGRRRGATLPQAMLIMAVGQLMRTLANGCVVDATVGQTIVITNHS